MNLPTKAELLTKSPAPFVPLHAWKQAVLDAAVVHWSEVDETNPRKTVNRLLSVAESMALDPLISSAAAALLRGEAPNKETQPYAPRTRWAPPALGSIWRHHSDKMYRVVMVANTQATDRVKFPVTIVYEDMDGGVWSTTDFCRWFRSFTFEATAPCPLPPK